MMLRLLPLCFALSITSVYAAQPLDLATLQQQIEDQQQQLDALKQQLTVQQENQATSPSSTMSSVINKTSIGGYGEALFSHLDNSDDQYDAYRFVLYVGHQFSDTVRLHSELEVEHALAGEGAPGEVELEQMFIEWQYAKNHAISVGQMLMPVGFVNEFHEPETFYGVKRNPIESNIIPTTWWEGGIKASGQVTPIEGLRYDVMVNSGLKTTDANIRSGRQKGAKANAEDLAYTARLRYLNNGFQTGLTYQHQTDLGQGDTAQDNAADLIELHASYQWQGIGLKALYAQWNIDGLSNTVNAQKSKQEGFFVETNYRLDDMMGLPLDNIGVFARYSDWDLAAANNAQGVNADSSIKQWNYGFNYYLTPQVVFKADAQIQDHYDKSKPDADGFTLGMGYSF